MSRPPKNYRWWQEHGDSWSGEVSARKAHMPIYHLQEIFLEEYFSQVAPAKVLEFGCGFGRHLEYLRRNRKLKVYGFDQSESMVRGMRWARKPWREKHITIGEPLERLPYDDGEFDVVFTVSVLIHVRPQDLDRILSELYRVSHGHVVHVENIDVNETISTSDAHDGCWAHDLTSAWARVAPEATCEVAPSMFDIEDVYRVLGPDTKAPPLISKHRASRFRQLDDAISGEIGRLREVVRQSEGKAKQRIEESNALRGRIDEALSEAADARAEEAEQRGRARAAEAKSEEVLSRVSNYRERAEALEAEIADARQAVAQQRDRAKLAEDEARENLDRARRAEDQSAALLGRAKEAEKRFDDLRDRATTAEARIEPLLDRATRAESRSEQSDLRLEEARRTIETRVRQLDEQKSQLAKAGAENEVLRVRARRAEDSIESLTERARKAEHSIESLTERARKAEHSVESLTERARKAEDSVESLTARARKAEASIESLIARARESEHSSERLRARMRESEAQIEPLRARTREAEAARATRSEEVKALRSRARSAEGKLHAAMTSLADTRAEAQRNTERLASELSDFVDRVTSLNERIEAGRNELQSVEAELRGAKDREASALFRATELVERLDGESARADELVATLMRSHGTQERLMEQERDTQSRVIALRRRAERAEAGVVELRNRAVDAEGRVDEMRTRAESAESKAEAQRARARQAEAEIAKLHQDVRNLQHEWGLERQRADDALGTIDEARLDQAKSDRELAALRTMLDSLVE